MLKSEVSLRFKIKTEAFFCGDLCDAEDEFTKEVSSQLKNAKIYKSGDISIKLLPDNVTVSLDNPAYIDINAEIEFDETQIDVHIGNEEDYTKFRDALYPAISMFCATYIDDCVSDIISTTAFGKLPNAYILYNEGRFYVEFEPGQKAIDLTSMSTYVVLDYDADSIVSDIWVGLSVT